MIVRFLKTGSKAAESSEFVQNVMMVIGDSIRLNCGTSNLIEWTHQRIDQPTPDDIYMDGMGLISDYKIDGRHSLENGTKHLLITNITTNDAGIYRCTIKKTWNDIKKTWDDIAVFNLAIAGEFNPLMTGAISKLLEMMGRSAYFPRGLDHDRSPLGHKPDYRHR